LALPKKPSPKNSNKTPVAIIYKNIKSHNTSYISKKLKKNEVKPSTFKKKKNFDNNQFEIDLIHIILKRKINAQYDFTRESISQLLSAKEVR